MLELQKFINEHKDWETLLTNPPYNLKINRDNDYIIFKYDQITADFNLQLVRECRGIILKDKTFEIVCFPFMKFGNYGESYCPEIDWEHCSVQEKVDGSLMKVWFDNGWHISTNGTIDAFKAEVMGIDEKHSYGSMFLKACPIEEHELFEKLNQDYTYMFELVSPETRVVIPYKTAKLYFLGFRNNKTKQEFFPEEHNELCKLFDIPKRYNMHTLEDVKEAADKLPWNEEGYVVCDRAFNRVKIKSPEYVKAHYSRTNGAITLERLVNIILNNEVDEFLIYAEEYKGKIKEITDKMQEFKIRVIQEAREAKKEFAFSIKDKPSAVKSFLFKCFNINVLTPAFDELTAQEWTKILTQMRESDEK